MIKYRNHSCTNNRYHCSSRVKLKHVRMALGWKESNTGTWPFFIFVTYNIQSNRPSTTSHCKRLVFQRWVPMTRNTNEIGLNPWWRLLNGVFLKKAVKCIINRLPKESLFEEVGTDMTSIQIPDFTSGPDFLQTAHSSSRNIRILLSLHNYD